MAFDIAYDIAYCLERLETIDKTRADRFLEYSVFNRRNLVGPLLIRVTNG